MRHIAICLAVLMLAACVQRTWVRPNTSAAQRDQDLRECAYEARKATAAITSGVRAGWEQGSLERQCMEVRQYRMQAM